VCVISKGIQDIDTKGIVSLDETRIEVDDIVYATGFITNPFLYDMVVNGRSGKVLWEGDQGSHAYLGMSSQAECHWILSLCYRFLQLVISIIFFVPKVINTKRKKLD
jgi:hypothetical protein